MSNQSNPNPTPTVQIREIGLPEQAPLFAVIGGAVALAGIAAAGIALQRRKTAEPEPESLSDSPRAYLQAALANARQSDLAKVAARQAREADSKVKRQAKTTSEQTRKDLEELVKTIGEQVAGAQGEAKSLIAAIRDHAPEIEKVLENEVRTRLAGFVDDAKDIASTGRTKGAELTDKAAEAAEKLSADLGTQAKQASEKFSADAQDTLQDLAETANAKRKVAAESLQRGSRETGSLLIWAAAAGLIVFGALLNEQQQQRVKDIATEALHEVRTLLTEASK